MKLEIDLTKVPQWRRDQVVRELYQVADDAIMSTTLEERIATCLADNPSDRSSEERVAMLMEVIGKYVNEADLASAILELISLHQVPISTDFSSTLRSLITNVFK